MTSRENVVSKLTLLSAAAALAALFSLSPSAFADNRLTNSGFDGEVTGEKFGWGLTLAPNQPSECTVVQGRSAARRALRVYNDELGKSFVSQSVVVQPWRWYVAEVWVKSDGMYSPDVRVILDGGSRRGQWKYVMDYFHRPPIGWRVIRAFEFTGESQQLTLAIGGNSFSGEVLSSEPILRPCSLVEAVSYHAKPGSRLPGIHGPPVEREKGLPGYAFLRSEVRRVAREFPNALRMSMDLPDPKDQDARISLWLPPGIRFLKLRPHGGGSRPPKVTQLPSDAGAPGGTHLELHTGRGETNLLVDSDLEPGEQATGYVSYEWNGGYQLPRPVVFEGVELPNVTAPKRIVASLDVYGAAYLNWENFNPGLDGQTAMVRDLQRLGFNRLQLWGGDARPYAKLGIDAGSSYGGSFSVDLEKYPDSGAVTIDGERSLRAMCPSYRGSGFIANSWVERVKKTATISSSVNLDDEVYLMSGVSPLICFCDRCVKRWDEWVSEKNPRLAGISPRDFFRRAHKYPEHYEAWLRFRCDLVAERFGILRDVFHEAVKQSGVKTTPEPELGAFTGEEMLVGLSSIEALSRVLDFISPMIYEDGNGVRREIAKIAPASGGKLVVCLAPGYNISPPGDARSQVLEAVMNGARGFVAWNLDIGPITTGHLADMSQAIRMLAPVEDIILDGQLETGYTADKKSAHLLARTQGGESVLLVSDYSPGVVRLKVTVPGESERQVVDLFSGEVVAHLEETQRSFSVTLKRDFQARLYQLR